MFLVLATLNALKRARIATQRLHIENKIRATATKYQQERLAFEKKSRNEIAAINQRAAIKMTKLQQQKSLNIAKAKTLKGASDLANEVFGRTND